ncbi:hypothetical protein [Streptomyces sp. NBC_01198]|uniref:hypothetical protein n=1 Tax=Streptomyces sp. NBC_01198 TaxID=2903769 RepID=UPI002E1227AC|nr:hypothetical protein OG702_18740 [Streptomyces sp. NBC_01198]
MRRSVGAAVVAAFSVGGLLLGNGSAQAISQDIGWTYTVDHNLGGRAEFVSTGDDLWVCDDVSGDSYGAGAILYEASGEVMETVYDGVPDGDCVSTNQNLEEQHAVYIQVCLMRSGVKYECARSHNGYT